jgi:hypothetical protein
MVGSPRLDVAERCADLDIDGGRCQLLSGHRSVHAAGLGDTFLTWEPNRVVCWSRRSPPDWLLGLPWSPEFRPAPEAQPR